jgi:hypothetical protein
VNTLPRIKVPPDFKPACSNCTNYEAVNLGVGWCRALPPFPVPKVVKGVEGLVTTHVQVAGATLNCRAMYMPNEETAALLMKYQEAQADGAANDSPGGSA